MDFKRAPNGSITVSRSTWYGVESGTKGSKPRRVPMTARLAAALRVIERIGVEHVFVRQRDDDTVEPITLGILGYLISKAERRAKLPIKGRAHILRHTFCSRLAMAGVPARVIQELAGHAQLSTSLRYLHLFEGSAEAGIAALESRPAHATSLRKG